MSFPLTNFHTDFKGPKDLEDLKGLQLKIIFILSVYFRRDISIPFTQHQAFFQIYCLVLDSLWGLEVETQKA